MTFDEYQSAAERTMTRTEDGKDFDPSKKAIYALGLAGEVGEAVEMIKKELGHGHQMILGLLEKELGDVLWYLCAIARSYDLDLDDIAWLNIEKLKARYPNGFSHERSINRDT